ncbi:MAG: lamin tail domain-containing protein, partial [Planctomycetes bacterium]|nr:lamin tail domain-containing protein [Planctomycetota bacterium]
MKGRFILCVSMMVGAWSLPAWPAELLISEFLASNRDNLADEDGDYPDWIEIHNAGPSEVDLEGWHLTDSAGDLTRWTFPAVKIQPRGFLLVFASEKDRRDPAGPLHTNFRLAEGGDYLALVAPDGTTVVSEYAPEYPEQVEDASFGVDMNSSEWVLVGADSQARIFIPADDSLGTTWIATVFDDTGWTAGPLGIGYDRKTTKTYLSEIQTDLEAAMYRVNATAYVRIPFTVDDPSEFDNLLLRVKYDDGFVAYL